MSSNSPSKIQWLSVTCSYFTEICRFIISIISFVPSLIVSFSTSSSSSSEPSAKQEERTGLGHSLSLSLSLKFSSLFFLSLPWIFSLSLSLSLSLSPSQWHLGTLWFAFVTWRHWRRIRGGGMEQSCMGAEVWWWRRREDHLIRP